MTPLPYDREVNGRKDYKDASAKRPHSIAELAEKARVGLYDDSKDFVYHLRLAEKHWKEGKESARKGDLEGAFISLARTVFLARDKLPMDKDYNTVLNRTQRYNLALNAQNMLDNLQELKSTLVDRYDKWLWQNRADRDRTLDARPQNIRDEGTAKTQLRQDGEPEQSPKELEDLDSWRQQRLVPLVNEARRQDTTRRARSARLPSPPDFTFSRTPLQTVGYSHTTRDTAVISGDVSRHQQLQEEMRLYEEGNTRRQAEKRRQDQLMSEELYKWRQERLKSEQQKHEGIARRQREAEEAARLAGPTISGSSRLRTADDVSRHQQQQEGMQLHEEDNACRQAEKQRQDQEAIARREREAEAAAQSMSEELDEWRQEKLEFERKQEHEGIARRQREAEEAARLARLTILDPNTSSDVFPVYPPPAYVGYPNLQSSTRPTANSNPPHRQLGYYHDDAWRGDACNLPSAQMHADNPDMHPLDFDLSTNVGIGQRKPRTTGGVQINEAVGIYTTTWSDLSSEEDYVQTDDCSLFSVQSFEPQITGLSPDIIVTVGMPPEVPETPFTAASTPRSIRRLSFDSVVSFIDASPGDFSDRISEYRSSRSYKLFETTTPRGGRLVFINGNENDQALSSGGVVDGNWHRLSMVSQETADEPPPELLLALGPGFKGVSRNEGPSREETSVDSVNPITNSKGLSPLYNISFIRDVSNVSIIGSHINFTTNIINRDEGDVSVGLHTLYVRSDPTALHNSYKRQKRMNQQMKAIRAWGTQLLISSSSTLGEYPLSVPRIKTRDLEEVIKDVFTWLYSVSSPYSIMWLYEYETNSRTSLIGQCLANFLGERRDLTASYFYTKRSLSQTGASHSGAGDNPSRVIPTIAFELTRRIPEIEIPIALTAANDLLIFDLSLDEQMKKLIVDPLQAASKGDPHKFPRLFLIHGLEDCNDDDFQELFLGTFGKSLTILQQSRIPQKLMLLGRHTPRLLECFSKLEMQKIVRQRLLPVSQDVAA